MRTQTFAAFLLTAALPAIVAALPTNIPSTQLTSVPAIATRSTHAIEEIALTKRSEDGGQPGYFPDEADAQDLEDVEEAGHGFGGEEPEELEESFMDGDLDDFAGFDFSQLQEQEQMLQRRATDSNYEGPFTDDTRDESGDFNNIDILQARSDELIEEPGIPSRFRRRHEGHEGTHDEQAGTIVDEDEDDQLERRQLDNIAEDDDEEHDEGAFAGLDMSAHAGDEEDDDDEASFGQDVYDGDEASVEQDLDGNDEASVEQDLYNDDEASVGQDLDDGDEASVEQDLYDNDEASAGNDYNDAELYEDDGSDLQRRDENEFDEDVAEIQIAKREVYDGSKKQVPRPIERRVARSFRA
ncbi:hypothetical protein MCOR25_009834 [Pyricularia grisea]|uniref:Uncharacterized protein n=1 Tax=Pyricularia grisea TaxID=148305 RepID=A0A6P8ARX2_PYRGI|nr:uncharacterized protein PgNI_09175 [Pyricularia grisea]KAI6351601.1 hypothetical protein MCOR25_009834 [Pyricularia grisea]TLD04865.1 hypothetical protein PgNI_09175 [Pyricularia grisea]